jgi:N-acetylmuramoyl-L-alanine amidase
MHQIIALTLAGALLAATPAVAQTSAKSTYTRLSNRDATARRALVSALSADLVRKDIARIVAGYEGLAKKFPGSPYSDNALWQAAMLTAESFARYRADADRETSLRLLRRLQAEYPGSSLVRQAKPAIARLENEGRSSPAATASAPPVTPAPAPAAAAPPPPTTTATRQAPTVASAPPTPAVVAVAPASAKTTAATRHTPAELKAIRRTNLPDVVRIAIELDREVEYRSDQIDDPDRVFVDLHTTSVATSVDASQTFDDELVKAIRLGPRPGGTTRVVVDLGRSAHYSVFTLYNPYRIVVDLNRAAVPGGPGTANAQPKADKVVRASEMVVPKAQPMAVTGSPVVERIEVSSDDDVKPAPQVDSAAPGATLSPGRGDKGDLSDKGDKNDASPDTLPSKSLTPKATGAPMVAPAPPSVNLEGRFSLSRQLGLGVSRIVIDPGHGGHDPGAQSRGSSEADAVLDIALRLEQLLTREPGVEVMLTRRTDIFVPLEERTAIANRQNADLFLSIHANASRNAKARGVETYFLNFASTPDAEAVAARENSASGRTMHSLPDIVKAITLNNKLDESRDFATIVQREMVGHLSASNKDLRDLGVKQAPFVVLIGAGMPSVLAEISFITHSQEGKLLRSKAYRQKIAEALYQGVERYQRSLKAVKTVANQ